MNYCVIISKISFVFLCSTIISIKEASATEYTINLTQEERQSKYPYGWKSLESLHINDVTRFKADNGHEYFMLFTSNQNDIEAKGTRHIAQDPPMVKQLAYHNIGKDKEFCGVILERDVLEEESGKFKGTIRNEMRLPDEVAQKIVDVITDYSRFKNKTNLKIREVNFADLIPTRLFE
jgi:hypothetical protein